MKIDTRLKSKYPKTAKFIEEELKKVLKDIKCINDLSMASGASVNEVRRAISSVTGPLIAPAHTRAKLGADGVFTPEAANYLIISEQMISKFERDSKPRAVNSLNAKKVYLLMATVLHEFVHYLNHTYGGADEHNNMFVGVIRSGKSGGSSSVHQDAGWAFEKMYFGREIVKDIDFTKR